MSYLNPIYNYIFNNNSTLINENDEIKTRMNKYINKNNKTCHPYKPFIVSLKSRQILSYFNYLTCIEDKLKFIDKFNEIMVEISKKIYMKYDPHMIYTFHDEIHLVFFYNENGNYIYAGNMNKIVTTFVSYISIEMSKLFTKKSIELDFVYTGQLIEFEQDYEVLNYLVWRQLDCKRNIITLLYKCINLKDNNSKDNKNNNTKDNNKDNNISNLKLDTMEKNVSWFVKRDLNNYYTGNILKKNIYYVNKNVPKIIFNNKNNVDNLTIRKSINVENFYFADNFKQNLCKYIKNKIM